MLHGSESAQENGYQFFYVNNKLELLKSFFQDPTAAGIAKVIEQVFFWESNIKAPLQGVSKGKYV
jgi:hypothetical protein